MTQVYRPDGVGDTIANIAGRMITRRFHKGQDMREAGTRGRLAVGIIGFHIRFVS